MTVCHGGAVQWDIAQWGSALPIPPVDPMIFTPHRVSIHAPENPTRFDFHEALRSGDSGNPCFLFINNQPVILTVWSYSTYGTSIHS